MPAMQPSRVESPDFPPNLDWLNSDRPLEFSDELRGQVVLLDFWTYACINCIHMVPVLREVERRYADQPVAVIGVHSNKFENEGEAEHIRSAIARYGVRHPVVVDKDHQLWDAFGVQAWPTLIFIDAEGNIVKTLTGERPAAEIVREIDTLLAEGREKDVLANGPLSFELDEQSLPVSGLSFPGRVLADAPSDRLFIADSNHNRIIVATLGGQIRSIVGSGAAGLRDGSAHVARFNNPQGMALSSAENLLFVADTGNHALRQIDLTHGEVKTLAGTGKQSKGYEADTPPTAQALSSPWDVALDGQRILIAMAGLHQIWLYDRANQTIAPWSGTGMEEILDGPANRAALAQPSGLAVQDGWLYFADSEASAIRKADLQTGEVTTIIGKGLFEFGDGEGLFAQTKFQHPLDVVADHEILYVADTYNHKIKKIDLENKRVMTVAGGKDGDTSGTVRLYEPAGLSLADRRLFIADTNNHRVVIFDTETGQSRELQLSGMAQTKPLAQGNQARHEISLPSLAAGENIVLSIELDLPRHARINAAAPMTLHIAPSSNRPSDGLFLEKTIATPGLPVILELAMPAEPFDAEHDLDLTFACCTEQDAKLCAPIHVSWRARLVTLADHGAGAAVLRGSVSGL